MNTAVIGLDTSKSWFQVHGIDDSGRALRRKLPRHKLLTFFVNMPRSIIGLEACGGAHHWARELAALGHEPRLMPARYVRPYVKTNKHDAADAEACWEAVQRPGMRFVPTKSVDQQAMLIIHRTRDLLVRQRTAAVNALRGQLGEFGVVAAKGVAKARELMASVAPDERIPPLARGALMRLVEQIRDTECNIEQLDRQIIATSKANPVASRLMTVLTIGPYAATAIAAMVGDAKQFSSGRHFAAWLGLVPTQHSTGGKERIGRISKRGDSYIRRLLIHGARAAVQRVRVGQVKGRWVAELLARRPFNIVTVALANRTARIAWAVMARGEPFRSAAS
jgi:transposase